MSVSRTSLLDVLAIKDPLYSDNFELSCTLPTGITGSNKNANGLRIQCRNVPIPGISNEAQDVMLHGFKTQAAGRTVFQNQMNVTYIEDRTLSIQRTLKNWVNAVRDFRTQKSKGKDAYTTNGILTIFDETGAVAKTDYIVNLFCQDVQDIQLDGSSANIVEVSATFRFDFSDESASSTGDSQH